MAMVVKNNMTAINTLNTLNKNSSALSKSLQKVSSGMKINSAADDASGYAISERMRVQIRSLDQANQNTQNGSSMMKVAEGAVSSTVEILKTLKEKAVNAANDSNTDSDRQTIQKELDQSIDQINDNANVTFNGKYLVDGSKNSLGKATYTALSNQNLSEDTKADTKLTKLEARSGDSLEIHDTDKVTVSYVQGGKTYSTTFQVGDKTLQDIFAAAEDIDKDNQIFATNDNDAVKAAGGAQGISSASAEAKAIEYLKGQLSNGTDADATQTPAKSTAGANAGNIADSTGAGDLATKGFKDGNGFAYGAGDLYNNVINADKELAKAESAMGEYDPADATKNKGTAGTLGAALKKAGIAWDGKAATLDTSDMEAKLKAAYEVPTNAGLKEAVAAYREDVADFNTAKNNMSNSVKAYEDATKQLDALEKQQKVNTAQAGADALRSALETAMGAGIDSATQIAYKKGFTFDDQGAIQNGTAVAAAAKTDTNAADMKAEFAKALDTIASKVLDGTYDETKGNTALNNLTTEFKGGAAGNDRIIAADAFKGYITALKSVKDAKDAVGTAADALKAAQENVVSKFTAPALMTGSNVGVNSADEVVTTASGQNAVTITANNAGIGGQISGLNISVSDAQGNVKKSANAALDAFEETVRAQNKSDDNAISLQVGAKANQSIKVGLTDMRAEALGLQGADGTKLNISNQAKANAAINVLDNAIQKALDQQTTIGSVESRLEYTSTNLTTASENVQASESTIRDADMAKEMTNYTRNNVLLQAAQSMLAQANQSSSNVLSLLQ